MALASNESNGRRTTYAAALIVAPLAESDIVDLVRRGFTVRPFLAVDSALAALVFGQNGDDAQLSLQAVRDNHVVTPASDRPSQPAERAPQPTDRTYTGEFASQICTRLDPSLPNGPIREFVHLCARKTRNRLSVHQAAQAIGIERSRLNALLREAGYPTADEVIRWMRLLHAVWLLSRTPRRSVKEVARALEFASGPSMSNTMKNVLGARPTELGERGGFDFVFATFRRNLDQTKAHELRESQPAA
jgi:AraC-like DNA-binding protein